MHLLNEVPFLAKVERTPTFLLYDRYNDKFKEVSLEDDNESSNGDIVETLTTRILKLI